MLTLVGPAGFEPATPVTPFRCATGLRYVPKLESADTKPPHTEPDAQDSRTSRHTQPSRPAPYADDPGCAVFTPRRALTGHTRVRAVWNAPTATKTPPISPQ